MMTLAKLEIIYTSKVDLSASKTINRLLFNSPAYIRLQNLCSL